LETALGAWQNGQSGGKVESHSPPIEVADADWLKGKKLENYEILSQKTEPDGFPWFTVRLQLAKPDGSQDTRYVVKGVEQRIWIYREKELERAKGWEGY
jgi:hypothetical protein